MELDIVDVVDKDDQVLSTIKREQAKDSDILRVVGVFIVNSENKLLLQLRSKQSYRYPLYWDCSGGGHVDSGEDYSSAAHRELQEEIGIQTSLKFLGKHYVELDDGRKHFAAFFSGSYEGDLNLDPNEVLKVKHFSIEEIKQMISQGEKIHPECLLGLKEYFL